MRYQPVLVRPSSKPQDQDDATMTEPSDTSNSNNNARELRAMVRFVIALFGGLIYFSDQSAGDMFRAGAAPRLRSN